MRIALLFGAIVVVALALAPVARAQEPSAGAATFPAEDAAAAPAPATVPAAPAPIAPSPALPPRPVSLVGRPGVAFYRELGSARPERICLAPCEVTGTRRTEFALGLDGAEPVRAPESVRLAPGTVVEGEYRSN